MSPARPASRRLAPIGLWTTAIIVVALLILPACSHGNSGSSSPSTSGSVCSDKPPSYVPAKYLRNKPFPMSIDTGATYQVRMATSCGILTFDLLPGKAPTTVNNFVNLANAHWYNGMNFFRTSKHPDFVQAGDPSGTGTGGPGYTIRGEKSIAYTVGSVAMVDGKNGTAGSQFMIVTGTDGLNDLPAGTVFGKLSDDTSLQVAQKIGSVPVRGDTPLKKVWILGVRVDKH